MLYLCHFTCIWHTGKTLVICNKYNTMKKPFETNKAYICVCMYVTGRMDVQDELGDFSLVPMLVIALHMSIAFRGDTFLWALPPHYCHNIPNGSVGHLPQAASHIH